MGRLYNTGAGDEKSTVVPTVKRRDANDSGRVKEYVKIPAVYTGCSCENQNIVLADGSRTTGRDRNDECVCGKRQFVEHKPGNVYVALQNHGFFTVPKGAAFEVPYGMRDKDVQAMCPHLVSEEDHILVEQEKSDRVEKNETKNKQSMKASQPSG